MSFKVDGINGICHHAYENPDVICFRDVINDAQVSPWYEWQGISQDISMKDFFKEVEDCNLSAEKLSIRAWNDENGIIIDYGLRHQFWIPMKVIENNEWDLRYLETPLEDRIDKKSFTLKPCPFCGGDARISVVQEHRIGGDEGFVIQCQKCYMNTASINGTYSPYSEDIIKMWNKRV